jgi:hypothetical protein
MIAPEIVIRVRPYPSRRQRAVQALLPKAVAFVVASGCILTVVLNA